MIRLHWNYRGPHGHRLYDAQQLGNVSAHMDGRSSQHLEDGTKDVIKDADFRWSNGRKSTHACSRASLRRVPEIAPFWVATMIRSIVASIGVAFKELRI